MALRKDITARILDLLRQNPPGLSITEIVRNSDINRNTAGRYLDNLLISGQVEMRHFGMAKIYSLSRRLPVSSVLSLSSELVMQVDSGLRVIFLNKPFAVLLGAEEKEITGKNIEFSKIPAFFDYQYPPLLSSIREGLGGSECRGELDLPGHDRSYAYRMVPIVFTNGQKGVSVILEDITERRRIEAALRESEARYRSLSEASQDLIFVIDREDLVLYLNQRAAEFLRIPAGSVIGNPRSRFFPPEVSSVQYHRLQQVFSTGRPMRNESPITTPGGDVLWFDHALMPILNDKGEVISVLGVSRDITKRIIAEQEQRQNEESSRFIAEHSVDIIHRLSPDFTCRYTSPSVTTLLGYSKEDVLDRPVLGMIHPEDLPRVMGEIAHIRKSGQNTVVSTFRFRHKEGHYILFESTTRVVRDASGEIREFLSISRDISGRKAT